MSSAGGMIELLTKRRAAATRVIDAFAVVPREEFVPEELRLHAYDDGPLPIGDGQTISQPYVVALSIDALDLQPADRVLEVGAGSGYAAAILGVLAREVITVERIEALARSAAARLARLGFANVTVVHADGSLGWPARAPYDAIVVAAAAPDAPRALLDQLAIGGRLVIPAGPQDDQHLLVYERVDAKTFTTNDLGAVRFVPLLGAQGWAIDAG